MAPPMTTWYDRGEQKRAFFVNFDDIKLAGAE
jgi:hypothetical protein